MTAIDAPLELGYGLASQHNFQAGLSEPTLSPGSRYWLRLLPFAGSN